MTYCDVCKKEIRNDEWRDHSISENHLEIEKMGYCKVCKLKNHISGGDQYTTYENKRLISRDYHNRDSRHKENQEFFDLYFS